MSNEINHLKHDLKSDLSAIFQLVQILNEHCQDKNFSEAFAMIIKRKERMTHNLESICALIQEKSHGK
jgi:hypothetical protein